MLSQGQQEEGGGEGGRLKNALCNRCNVRGGVEREEEEEEEREREKEREAGVGRPVQLDTLCTRTASQVDESRFQRTQPDVAP